MTSERRLLMGFDDIRAITLECKDCNIRLTIAPDKVDPDTLNACPGCRRVWISGSRTNANIHTTAAGQFFTVLDRLIDSAKPDSETSVGMRILFEFEEPE